MNRSGAAGEFIVLFAAVANSDEELSRPQKTETLEIHSFEGFDIRNPDGDELEVDMYG